MLVNSQKIIKIIEGFAPKYYAEKWDNVGFQVGNMSSEVDKVMVTLDITDDVIDEAIEKNVDLIITHHPLIFSSLKSITDDTVIGRRIRKLIKHGINVYAAHTNLDMANGGLSDYLAEVLELDNIKGLSSEYQEKYLKLSVFVPNENQEDVRSAMFKYGAGNIESYSECSFTSNGIGTFKPLDGSNPYIGTEDQRISVDEVKIDVIIRESDVFQVVDAMKKAHPYEVPAYDLIKLENVIESYSVAKYGTLQKQMTVDEFVEHVKAKLNLKHIKMTGSREGKLYKVGLCNGAGADFIKAAKRAGCDIFVTGDVKYHEAQSASEMGLRVIDAGHYETENIYMDRLKDMLVLEFEKKGYDVNIIRSEVNTNYFEYL